MADGTPSASAGGVSSRPGDVVDLDVLRAARLEATPERVVRFGGREWRLVPEVPFIYAELWRDGQRADATKLLFADPVDGAEFFALSPSSDDIGELVKVYNTTSGKS